MLEFEKAVKDKKEKSVFDFNNIIPYPKEFSDKDEINSRYQELQMKKDLTLKEKKELILMKIQHPSCDSDGYNQGGYNWCCGNWGTKWNACRPELTRKKGLLIYGFDTAWGPALPIMYQLVLMFPRLSIKLKYKLEGEKGVFHWP